MHKCYFRFYEELNDFLPLCKKKERFTHHYFDRASVKDMIESLGVPHIEIDMILVNGKSVNFSYIIKDEDDISVYPVFESFDISDVQHLRPQPLRDPKYVIDVHLGKLAAYLRMLGFDSIYKIDFSRDDIVALSLNEKRTILTRDRNILKRNDVTHGYWVRNNDPEHQLYEVVKRFQLKNFIKEYSRCMLCNSLLIKAEKAEIIDDIPPKVAEIHNDFYQCTGCKKIYWKGSHIEEMNKKVGEVKSGS
ncbi:MAG: Mut7-C ubiquitin/RNAse domain-containing protein [Ignavibacteriales bacterium]|nr:MAG: Mut7-C ubiquitin/RNAse domain-containing protein [Ignavibacteriales bacterium]